MSETSVLHSDKAAGTSFARIDNAVLQDKRLSFRARGVLAYVLSQPPDWDHSAERLAEASTEGEKAVISALKELEALGYSWLEKSRDPRGTVRNRRRFCEAPTPGNRASATEPLKTEVGHRPAQNRPPVDRPPVNRPPVDRPVGEGGVYETTTEKRLLLQQSALASAAPALPGMEELAAQPQLAPPPQKPKVSPRPRNSLFDALASITDGNPAELTRDAAGAVGHALKTIREVCPNLTPDEIGQRAVNYRLHFPNVAITATALARHWARCAQPPVSTAAPVRFCQ